MNFKYSFLTGKSARFAYLFAAAVVLLMAFLGTREIWTQEHRWADIVSGMFFRHDFLHPYLNDVNYYDKPLLSYWLIVLTSFLTGLTTWALRLPSALAGLLAIWSIYRLGTVLQGKRLGLLAGWLLLTSFYFVFWARTSSADMLNMAGSLFAVCWYFEKRESPSFFNYAVFFLILALTALCKGLVGIIVPLIAIFPDLVKSQEWKKHLRWSFLLAMVPAAIVYVLPFWASAHFGVGSYEQSGLYLVYRENILRYFQPFDHKGPIYTYFVFLPVYLLPWTVFFIPALFSLKNRWKKMPVSSRWIVWALFLLFLFFTLSGSRRNYYVLPMVPFAVLMTADWILNASETVMKWVSRLIVIFFTALFLHFVVLQPLYYSGGGVIDFSKELKQKAEEIKPWESWQVVLLDPESKVRFYLQLSPELKNQDVVGPREQQTTVSLSKRWSVIQEKRSNVIFISRKQYLPFLKKAFPHAVFIASQPTLGERFLRIENLNSPVAFIVR